MVWGENCAKGCRMRKGVFVMLKINIVMADSDELYLNHINNYLIEHTSNFELASFTAR